MIRGLVARGLVVGCALALVGCAAAPRVDREQAITNTLWELATSAEKLHDYASAVGQYHQVYERDPANVGALLGMARTMRYSGLPKDAIKELKIFLDEKGERPDVVLELGKAQFAAALVNDARDTLERYRRLAPRDWQAHAVLALVHDRLGRHAEAQAGYQEGLKLSPGSITVSNNLALSYAISGELEKAIAVLRKVVDNENATAQMRQNLALLYALRGETEMAERLAAEDLAPEQVIQNMTAFRLLRGEPPRPRARPAPRPER